MLTASLRLILLTAKIARKAQGTQGTQGVSWSIETHHNPKGTVRLWYFLAKGREAAKKCL